MSNKDYISLLFYLAVLAGGTSTLGRTTFPRGVLGLHTYICSTPSALVHRNYGRSVLRCNIDTIDFLCLEEHPLFLDCDAKVQTFSGTAKLFRKKMHFFRKISCFFLRFLKSLHKLQSPLCKIDP